MAREFGESRWLLNVLDSAFCLYVYLNYLYEMTWLNIHASVFEQLFIHKVVRFNYILYMVSSIIWILTSAKETMHLLIFPHFFCLSTYIYIFNRHFSSKPALASSSLVFFHLLQKQTFGYMTHFVQARCHHLLRDQNDSQHTIILCCSSPKFLFQRDGERK